MPWFRTKDLVDRRPCSLAHRQPAVRHPLFIIAPVDQARLPTFADVTQPFTAPNATRTLPESTIDAIKRGRQYRCLPLFCPWSSGSPVKPILSPPPARNSEPSRSGPPARHACSARAVWPSLLQSADGQGIRYTIKILIKHLLKNSIVFVCSRK